MDIERLDSVEVGLYQRARCDAPFRHSFLLYGNGRFSYFEGLCARTGRKVEE